MMDLEIILMAFAIFCFVMALKALLDLRSIVNSMRDTVDRMLFKCDSMLDSLKDAGRITKKLIKRKGR